MKNLSKILLVIGVIAVIAFGGSLLLRKEKKLGEGSSTPLIDEVNKIRQSKGLSSIQLDNNLCAFAMQRTTEYKLSQNKEDVHNSFTDAKEIAKKSSLKGYINIEESVLIYERDRTPAGDDQIANDFAQKQETPLVLNEKIKLGCIEEEAYEGYRYFVFIGASKD